MDGVLVLELFVLLAVVGAIAGVIAGLLGVGGGIVLVPAFYHVFAGLGYDGEQIMQVCLGTSLATIIVTSIRSVLAHHRRGAVDWQILRQWAPGIALGALVGVWTVGRLSSATLQGIFGGLAFVIGLYLGFGRQEWRLGERMPGILARIAISPLIGFLSVLMGIGGGSFGVPLMTLFGVPIHRAVATAAGFGLVIALPSVSGFLFLDVAPDSRPPYTIGAVNLPAFLVVVMMTTLTAPIGARIAHALDPRPLRRAFAIFLLLVAANMLRKALTG